MPNANDDRAGVNLQARIKTQGRGFGIATLIPSTRNLLDKSSDAQNLDGPPSDGESAFPAGLQLTTSDHKRQEDRRREQDRVTVFGMVSNIPGSNRLAERWMRH